MYSVVLWVLVHCMSSLSYCLFDHRFCRDFLCIPPISVHPFALVLHENVQVVCFNQSKFENVCKCKEWFEIRPLKLIKKYLKFHFVFYPVTCAWRPDQLTPFYPKYRPRVYTPFFIKLFFCAIFFKILFIPSLQKHKTNIKKPQLYSFIGQDGYDLYFIKG